MKNKVTKDINQQSSIFCHAHQRGQVVIVLLLITIVALSIGLSLTSRSVSEIKNTNKIEQSSRAYYGAEAGLERAISQNLPQGGTFQLDNDVQVTVTEGPELPEQNGQALEYPNFDKEQVAQVWLLNPKTLDMRQKYSSNDLDIYYGNYTTPKPAFKFSIIYAFNNAYQQTNFYIDQEADSRPNPNGFSSQDIDCNSNNTIDTSVSRQSKFECKVRLSNIVPSGAVPIVLRARMFYSSNQKFAVKPVSGNLPPQARLYTSIGTTGSESVQRVLQILKIDNVVPPFFDYAIFSAGDIRK
jgi:hypothetical protein